MSRNLGHIYQATYRVRDGRPVLHFYGRLQSGAAFVVRDDRQVPHFYIRAADQHRLAGLQLQSSDKHTMTGEPVTRVEVRVPGEAPTVRDRLHGAGVHTFEADVRFAMRHLIDRDIRSGVEVLGQAHQDEAGLLVFDNPELRPAEVTVPVRVLSFDIETNPRTERLLAISVYGLGADEVVIVDGSGRPMPERAVAVRDEYAALDWFCTVLKRLDVDVLTGWNVVDFDLAFLQQVAKRTGHSLKLGRDGGDLRLRKAEGYFGSGQATIPGRVVLDGLDLLRGAFVRMEDYSLEAVSRQVLGEGKAVQGEVRDRVEEILSNYRHNLEAFATYARTDARLPLDIVERLQLVSLAFARSRLTGMPPDRVSASIASFDFLYLAALARRGIVAPTVRSDDSRVFASQAGGQVFEPLVGVHDNVWVFDFKSLYPSIIRTYGIDPLNFVPPGEEQDDDAVVGGARFRRGTREAPAILPDMLDGLFPQREAAKKRGDDVASQAIKILMNSFYGVLGTPACRFSNPAIAGAITAQGRHLLSWLKRWFEGEGFTVLYGDTDSVFVLSGCASVGESEALAKQLVAKVNAELGRTVAEESAVESRLELEYEKLYSKLFLASVRHGSGGARKRYAGIRPGRAEPEFVGMEVVRRDWTDLAKEVQRELYQRLFDEQPVAEYLEHIVQDVRDGNRNAQLVYRKGLRKGVDAYTASTPPHVAAARKSKAPPGRIIAYVMTAAGPEPLDNITSAYDLEHYIDKQIRPVAEPVLSVLGLEFDKVIGDDRQLGLF